MNLEKKWQSGLDEEFLRGTSDLWYLSFAEEDKFLGGCFVDALGFFSAVEKTHDLGINPGGAVQAHPVINTSRVAPEHKNKLLSLKDMERLGYEPVKWE